MTCTLPSILDVIISYRFGSNAYRCTSYWHGPFNRGTPRCHGNTVLPTGCIHCWNDSARHHCVVSHHSRGGVHSGSSERRLKLQDPLISSWAFDEQSGIQSNGAHTVSTASQSTAAHSTACHTLTQAHDGQLEPRRPVPGETTQLYIAKKLSKYVNTEHFCTCYMWL